MKTVKALKQVFLRWQYALLAAVVALSVLLAALWLPNARLVSALMTSSRISPSQKVAFIVSSFTVLGTNFTPLSAGLMVVTAALTGVNIALMAYLVSRQQAVAAAGGAGFLGAISGLLGIGCASCGSVIASLAGISGALAFLPFGGVEFGWLGIILLGWSLVMLVRRLAAPPICQS